MPLPKMAVLAEGSLPTGQRWFLRAGGNGSDFSTFLLTIHPDGHRDEGGMGGPPLYPGSLMNTYTGSSERGMCRVLVRADPRVARVRVQLGSGEQLDLLPVAARPDLGLVFFATLLPPSAVLGSIAAIDEKGQMLEPQDMSGHEAERQRFLRQHWHPEDWLSRTAGVAPRPTRPAGSPASHPGNRNGPSLLFAQAQYGGGGRVPGRGRLTVQ